MRNLSTDVAIRLRQEIEAGRYPPHEPLPAERPLAEELGVHRATLRRALTLLEAEGVVHRALGRGCRAAYEPKPLEGSIGCCVGDTGDPLARTLIPDGIVDALRERGTRIRLAWSDDRPFRHGDPPLEEVRSLTGLVLWPSALTSPSRLRELRRAMPTIVLNAPVAGFEADFVGFDDEGAGYEAARHLFERGHRRVAFVDSLEAVTARDRRAGFLRLLRERGLEAIEGYEALDRVEGLPARVVDAYVSSLLEAPPSERPTAVLCGTDETAVRIVAQLSRRGLSVPDDLALMGFGGSHPVLLRAFGLTTMEQPLFELGREAALLLLDRLHGRATEGPREIRLPMSLVVRSSCRLPPWAGDS